MLEIAGTAPSSNEMEKLTDRIFGSAGLQAETSMKFDDFKKAFSDHSELLQKVFLDLKGRVAHKFPMRNYIRIYILHRYLDFNFLIVKYIF